MADSQTAQAEVSLAPLPVTPAAFGLARPDQDHDYLSAHAFLVRRILATVAGSALVQVVAVTNDGGVSPIGTVDVTPLVNQIDGLGNATPHGTVHGLPYARVQGGADAVILDPKVGDIGIAVFCDRDISGVKATKGRANPGSRRQNDMADGVYLQSCVAQAPTQYVRFSVDGIELVSPSKVRIQAPAVEIDASSGVTINTPLVAVSGDLTAQGTSVHTHHHGGVKAGSDTSGQPV